MGTLEGKKAVIIGASGGIGFACAKRFAKEGAAVYGSYRRKNSNIEILSKNQSFTGFPLDLSETETISEKLKSAVLAMNGIDILINAAGTADPQLLFSAKPDRWKQVIHSNLISVFYTIQSVVIPMVSGKGGSIINIASVFGIRGGIGQSSYCASKSGVIGLTKSAALELASKKIRVNAVAPGYIETAMTQNFSEKQRRECIEGIPMKRFGTAEETAGLCAFLAGDDASYITGQTFVIDGGLSI